MINGINHVVLKVRGLEASDRFYRGLLGMKLVGQRGRMWFYSAGAHHHDFALVEIGADAPLAPPQAAGLFHLCFNVQDEDALRELYTRLRDEGVSISDGVDHVVMHSFYLRDPDGNTIEIGVDVPEAEWESVADPYAVDSVYDLA